MTCPHAASVRVSLRSRFCLACRRTIGAHQATGPDAVDAMLDLALAAHLAGDERAAHRWATRALCGQHDLELPGMPPAYLPGW